MPNSEDKKKLLKRRANNSSKDVSGPPKKSAKKDDDGIAKSKQLAVKLRSSRSRTTKPTINNENRVCGNGKPMPSLAELEKMFEDSDEDMPLANVRVEAVKTPKCLSPVPNVTEIISPKIIDKIATKMLDIITNLSDDAQAPPSVIPVKRPKKSGIPYIVGCKDRPKIPEKPSNNFCKGDDYGISKDTNEIPDNDDKSNCGKRRKRSKAINISKSIFNAKSDEIAAMLTEAGNQSDGSGDSSNKTVPYMYSFPSPNRQRSFSPLPSTSKDSETILKNEKLFNNSLLCESQSNDSFKNEVEVVEMPIETIVIDEVSPYLKLKSKEDSPINLDTPVDSPVQIIDLDDKTKPSGLINVDSPTRDDYYASLDINQNYDDDICEIIDVDDVIAENKAIIEKYKEKCKEPCLNTITLVQPDSTINPEVTQKNKSTNITNTTNCGVSSMPESNSCSQDIVQKNNQIKDIVTNFFNQQPDVSLMTEENVNNHQKADMGNRTDGTFLNRVRGWLETLLFDTTNPQQEYTASNSSMPTTDVSNIANNRNIFQDIIVNPAQLNSPITILDSPYTNQPTSRKSKPVKNKKATNNSKESNMVPTVESPKVTRSLGDCPICMDNLAKTAVASTTCGHVFCMSCIKESIKAIGKKCPTCRKSLRGIGYHPLFL